MKEELDIGQLISLVSQAPAIWDKSLPDYHSRAVTTEAWRCVCSQLNPQFRDISDLEKTMYCKTVMNKWRNIRDQWAKVCRKVAYQKRAGATDEELKHYIYHDKLEFLNRNTALNETESNFEDMKLEFPENSCETDRSDVETDGMFIKEEPPHQQETQQREQEKLQPAETSQKLEPPRKKRRAELEARILEALHDDDPRMHFFKSILPSIKDFTEDETLQLHSGIINLVLNIKRSRPFQPHFFMQPGFAAYIPDSSSHSCTYSSKD